MPKPAPIALLLLAAASPAAAKEIVGRYGYAGEWSVEAKVAETSRTWYGSRQWAGTARVRHTGLCSVSGDTDQTGEMTLSSGPTGRISARLRVGSVDCVYSGRLRAEDTVFAECDGGASVPMTLWER